MRGHDIDHEKIEKCLDDMRFREEMAQEEREMKILAICAGVVLIGLMVLTSIIEAV